MQWSKLKTRFRAFICDELQSRLDFHVTSYRESHDGAGEIWITFDGKKLIDYGHYRFEFAEREGYHSGLAGEELEQWMTSKEIFSPRFVGTAMREYLDMTIDEALASGRSVSELARQYRTIRTTIQRARAARAAVTTQLANTPWSQ